jgi:hypothetical protein
LRCGRVKAEAVGNGWGLADKIILLNIINPFTFVGGLIDIP